VIGAYPPMTRKYQIVESSGPNVIGRPTTEVDLMTGSLLAERMYLDQATGLLLRREELDASGQAVRVVGFVQLSVGPPAGMTAPNHAVDQRPRTIGVSALPAPYHAPAQLSQGYQRVAVLRRFDGIEVVYSDGLHSLSVFERPGHLDAASLPSHGTMVAVDGRQAFRYAWPGGQVVVWHAGDSSYTVVGDAPAAEVVSAIATLPSGGTPTTLQRVRRACRRLVQAVSGEW
jgi:sigma-E factor negative regulatory protein RseB